MIRTFILIAFIVTTLNTIAQTPLSLTTAGELQTPSDALVTKSGESVLIPNTHISIIPPDHFMFSQQMQGFYNPGTSSAIQISEILGTSYIMVCKKLTPEYIQSQNMTYKNRIEVTTQYGYDGYIYILGFTSKGVDYERLMFLAGDYHHTIWANVSYPLVSKNLLYETMKESLLTAQFIK